MFSFCVRAALPPCDEKPHHSKAKVGAMNLFAILRQNIRFVFPHIFGFCSLNPSHRTIIEIILWNLSEEFFISVVTWNDHTRAV